MIRAMYLALQQSSRGPATFVQDAGVAALNGSQTVVQEMRQEYTTRRRILCDALANVTGVTVVPPEAGFFAMVDIRALGQPSQALRRQLLHDSGVVVMHGSAYGPSAEGMLRVSFASGGPLLREGLDRLRAGLTQIGSL